jgi:hypothetical protein
VRAHAMQLVPGIVYMKSSEGIPYVTFRETPDGRAQP